jgi:hypothetical protein
VVLIVGPPLGASSAAISSSNALITLAELVARGARAGNGLFQKLLGEKKRNGLLRMGWAVSVDEAPVAAFAADV